MSAAEKLRTEERKELEDALFGFPEDIETAYAMFRACDEWGKRLSDRAKGLRKFLREMMPAQPTEETKDIVRANGIKRTTWLQKTVSYGKAMPIIKNELVPKTKWERFEEILNQVTSVGERDRFELDEE